MALTQPPDFTGGILTPAKLQQLSDAISDRTPLLAIKTLDETVTATTVAQNDDELFLPVEANARYTMSGRIVSTSPGAADFKLVFSVPALTTMRYSVHAIGTGTSAWAVFESTESTITIVEGAAADRASLMIGTVNVGANAGTLRIQWAQFVSDPGNTIVKAGSFFELIRRA